MHFGSPQLVGSPQQKRPDGFPDCTPLKTLGQLFPPWCNLLHCPPHRCHFHRGDSHVDSSSSSRPRRMCRHCRTCTIHCPSERRSGTLTYSRNWRTFGYIPVRLYHDLQKLPRDLQRTLAGRSKQRQLRRRNCGIARKDTKWMKCTLQDHFQAEFGKASRRHFCSLLYSCRDRSHLQ